MFSCRLKQLRESLGMTQDELAKKLNLTQSTIAYYENGKKMPTLENAIIITNLFNTSLDYLVGTSDCQTTENIKESEDIYYSNIILDDANSLSYESLKDLRAFIEFLKFRDKQRNNSKNSII